MGMAGLVAVKDSKKEGTWTTFYENGNKKLEINFIKGIAEGKTNSYFENISSRALGDVEALTVAQKATLNSAAVPYPTDIEMVVRCSDALKQAIRNAMQTNRRYIN